VNNRILKLSREKVSDIEETDFNYHNSKVIEDGKDCDKRNTQIIKNNGSNTT